MTCDDEIAQKVAICDGSGMYRYIDLLSYFLYSFILIFFFFLFYLSFIFFSLFFVLFLFQWLTLRPTLLLAQ